MPPVPGDTVLFGGPPKADEYVPGAVWLWGWTTAADPLKLELIVYAYSPPNAVDWGDGSWEPATSFTASTSPVGSTPGLWTAEHAYDKPSGRKGYVEAGGARVRFSAVIGEPPATKYPAYKKAREDLADEVAGQAAIGQPLR